MSRWSFIALACTILVGFASGSIAPETEPQSGISFPGEIAGETSALRLAGTAVRVKKIAFISIQIYAVGLYVEPAAAATAKVDSGNAQSAALFETLLSDKADIPMAVRLVMVRSVTADQMADALRDAVAPRLAHGTDVTGVMAQFRALFDDALPAGTELVFSKLKGGKLLAEIAGKMKGEIDNRSLSTALFSAYLDANHVVDRALLVANLPAVVTAGVAAAEIPATPEN
eukprot:CAMPEP_0180159608 /NCGR_PEP_ID=MMETSP0986-20121125/27620_1 /TAXON_ID=697907 /ORGANISM="non described non described, Strain CCMP2293" /LENGTH=228 /DNA_ID=CAMNT_0022109715 /DNA_START=32 /DNA_END=718 /DNA_ORIENTATION=+